jgi:26S proteasome regulatory subunit N4
MGLPLRMDNMHAPTIPSGPTSRGSTNGIKTNGRTLQELQAQKDSLEAELRALSGVLDSVRQLELPLSGHN